MPIVLRTVRHPVFGVENMNNIVKTASVLAVLMAVTACVFAMLAVSDMAEAEDGSSGGIIDMIPDGNAETDIGDGFSDWSGLDENMNYTVTHNTTVTDSFRLVASSNLIVDSYMVLDGTAAMTIDGDVYITSSGSLNISNPNIAVNGDIIIEEGGEVIISTDSGAEFWLIGYTNEYVMWIQSGYAVISDFPDAPNDMDSAKLMLADMPIGMDIHGTFVVNFTEFMTDMTLGFNEDASVTVSEGSEVVINEPLTFDGRIVNEGRITANAALTMDGSGYSGDGVFDGQIAGELPASFGPGSEIVLAGDVTAPNGLTIDGDLSIDGQGNTLYGSIVLDAIGASDGIYTVILKDLVMDGKGTRSIAVSGQNQNDDVRPVNLTMEDVSVSGYTSKGVYLTNVQNLNVTGCSFNDNATTEQTWYSGDYAFDINLCGIRDAVIVIEDTAFAGVSGGNSPVKITQRGGTDETDDASTDIHTSVAATIGSVTISGCTFDITAGQGGKSPMADIVIGSSPNADGTARTYTQAYDLTVSTGTETTVAYRNGTTDGSENLLVFSLPSDTEDALVVDGTVSDGAGVCSAVARGAAVSGTVGSVRIAGGFYANDVSDMLADGLACYDYSGISFVSIDDSASPALVIAGIPFASVGDALTLINVAGEFATADGDVLTLTADIPDTGDVAMTVPANSGLTIDLNGHDMAIGVVTVAGALNIADSVGEGTLTATGIVVTAGSVAGSGTISAAPGTVNLISIVGSGSVCGLNLDISDVASNGGAIEIGVGLTGSAVIDGVTIVIDGADAVADRGIYVNQMPDAGSAVIRNVTFAFDRNDACPLTADVDGNTDLTIDGLRFVDCTRTNKVLLNSVDDVTIGSEGDIRISGATDVVLWDASSTGKTFTVAGDLVVGGRMALTFDGNLIIPENANMIVNGSLEIHSDGTVEGRVCFGSDMKDSILLSDVVAGEDGLTLSLGSVVMSGSVESGAMTVSGTGKVEGSLDLGESILTIPGGSTFNVARNSEVSGASGLVVEGKMNVYGTVSAPVTNSGELYTIGNGAVTGAVTGDEPQEKEDEPLSIEFIPDMVWTLGEERSISIGVHPIDATITGLTGADWLTFDGNVISGAPTEVGTYTITLTVGVDNGEGMETTPDTFVITVVETPVEDGPQDDGDGFDWRIIAIVILIIVIAFLVLRNFIG